MIFETLEGVLIKNGIITAFVFVALAIWVSYWLSNKPRVIATAEPCTLPIVSLLDNQ